MPHVTLANYQRSVISACHECHEEDAHSFDRPQHNEGLGGAGDVLHNGN